MDGIIQWGQGKKVDDRLVIQRCSERDDEIQILTWIQTNSCTLIELFDRILTICMSGTFCNSAA